MDTEILVYLQKVKSFLKTNEEASKYFIGESDVDEFYKNNKDVYDHHYTYDIYDDDLEAHL